MPQPFRSFVIFAGMRTGSNLLEATLNGVKRVTCFGELFNPYMLGWPGKEEIKGITAAERDADPQRLLRAVFTAPNLNGFRYFHDHDPRVFDAIMDDPACAKIVLTRNPVDSYVSTRLAWETNQWKLNETETPIRAAITFDPAEFRETLDQNTDFLERVQHRLQASGQAGFWLGYDDLRDPKVMTGLLHWLGRTDLAQVLPASDQVPQNPREMAEKVANFDEMQGELARLDPFQLHRLPNFEPKRGPSVPTFVAADAGAGLIYQPIMGGPTARIEAWLRGFGPLTRDFTQASLRQWKRAHPGHRGFTVLTHPLDRAWAALRIVVEGPRHGELRRLLRETHRVRIPQTGGLDDLGPAGQQPLLAAFLDFLRRNLSGQTTIPTHRAWASQSEVLSGFAQFSPPDLVLRDETLQRDIIWLCEAVGLEDAPELPARPPRPAFLRDPDLRKAAKQAYLRDYVMLGFEE
ncbi:hypothetical protein GI374_10775 [Paracoccus sp. S-4012]|uniref:hypothetical protein n=1 Tax=Paracoccus sp. S-4012 TaxID=2665648 RepID=UPI0012B092DC|nr:hypothetical protein [Paracoccus sp. S-4012]MRX50921.1 hypothetical protein [Paracoccus sp. S-4012]